MSWCWLVAFLRRKTQRSRKMTSSRTRDTVLCTIWVPGRMESGFLLHSLTVLSRVRYGIFLVIKEGGAKFQKFSQSINQSIDWLIIIHSFIQAINQSIDSSLFVNSINQSTSACLFFLLFITGPLIHHTAVSHSSADNLVFVAGGRTSPLSPNLFVYSIELSLDEVNNGIRFLIKKGPKTALLRSELGSVRCQALALTTGQSFIASVNGFGYFVESNLEFFSHLLHRGRPKMAWVILLNQIWNFFPIYSIEEDQKWLGLFCWTKFGIFSPFIP